MNFDLMSSFRKIFLILFLVWISFFLLFTGLVGGLDKQIWHIKWFSNFARSLHEWPSTERPDHRCTYKVKCF